MDSNLSEIIVMILAGILILALLWDKIKKFIRELKEDKNDIYIGR